MKQRPLTELTEYRNSFDPPRTLGAVAEKLDVTPATIWRWENGERAPDRPNLLKIAELIGKPAAQLAGLDQ